MIALPLALSCLLLAPAPLRAEPFTEPPAGYTLVADDDCGSAGDMPHVVRGQVYVFSQHEVAGSREERDIIFDHDFCLLRYTGLNPNASYKVDVTYATQAAGPREQSLEANGLVVHDTLPLPVGRAGRFIYTIPPESYAGGQPLELKFIRRAGANAVVCYVRLWSTDPRPLPGRFSLWKPQDPVEQDWFRQSRLAGKPIFCDWEDPEREVRQVIVPCIDEQLQRGYAILEDLELLEAPDLHTSRQELAAVARERDRLLAARDVTPTAWLQVYRSVRWAVRRLAFKNPLLDCDGLLFVRRHHPHAMHQCARRLGPLTLPGGGICVLRNMGPDGEPTVTCLTEGRFPNGVFGRPDLSFDGRRIVFGFAPERAARERHMDYGGVSERTAPLYAQHRVGPCETFQVWEMGLQGDPPPRQLTSGPAENSDPLYLPDGRIAFMSHRAGGLVQCGDWALAYCVYTMNPDGSDLRQITRSKDGEWDPFLLEDGTIGFTRWEYVMKFWAPIQMLWAVRPDGTNPRMIYGSDLSASYAYPLNYACARQIPGTGKLVCIGSAHHNTGAGPVCIVDLSIGPNDAAGLRRLTPVRYVETADQQPDNGWYDCPYPLNENYFLVSHSLSVDETDTTSYGIYLLDAYGGRELIYRDPELSALFPTPLRPRRRPPVLPPLAQESSSQYGELLIQDVHQGLAPEARGQARYVQVVECHERYIHTTPYDIQVGPDSGFETKTVLGTVPVESDGSAFFRLPAGKSVFFSVLDERFQALNTMRSVTNVQGGERTSCIGCHEPSRRGPANRTLLSVWRAPSDIEPPPWGLQPMDFEVLVQPVLDRNCVRCHDGSGAPGKAFDLSASNLQSFAAVPVPASYFNLRPHVRHAPIFSYSLPAGSFGSRVSPLMQTLAAGHHGVTLSPADWRLLCAWIDCNCPAIGSYEVAARGKAHQRIRMAFAARRGDVAVRREALARSLAPGQRLACYLDCGPMDRDGVEGDVMIREIAGYPYVFGGAEQVAAPWYADISFDGTAVEYEITGLRPDRSYQLGFSWWDFDNGGRYHQVTAAMEDGTQIQLVSVTRLPAWNGKQEQPAELTVDIPRELTKARNLRISFANASASANAVVSEVWVVED